jgi:hypothetical protein
MNRFYDIIGDCSTQLSPWELKTRGLNKDKGIFLLHDDLRFRSDIAGGDIVVPAGFLSDLASIPAAAWSVFMAPDNPHIALGAWIHDLLYSTVGKIVGADGKAVTLTRQQCDSVLCYEAMPDLDATKLQQDVVYEALRLGGESSFTTAPPDVRWKFSNIPIEHKISLGLDKL